MKNKKRDNKLEFSKALLIQESILIWINTVVMLVLAAMCIVFDYISDIPWLAVMAGLPWAAYAVSQRAYYKKAQAENTKNGIKYESVLKEYEDSNEDEDEEILG